MKPLTIILSIIFLTTFYSSAQNVIAVQQGSSAIFYISLDSAITYAVDGDTIYLPGGNFTLNTNISKRLHIIGVGHNPDSTVATNPTNIIATYFRVITGASGGSLIGVKLSFDFYFGTSSADDNVSNYTVGRCYITGAVSTYSSAPINNLFYENIIASQIILNQASYNYFYNNIIMPNNSYGLYSIGTGNVFKNNVFIYSSYLMYNVNYSIFENNIFDGVSLYFSGSIANNIFNNNLFTQNMVFPFTTNNTGINNIVNQLSSSIFVNQSGYTFNYTQDYRIQGTSPGHNGGNEGTDVGIYGGTTFPWKTGSVPFNPHIQYQVINGSTDVNGNLPVNIKVEAQDH